MSCKPQVIFKKHMEKKSQQRIHKVPKKPKKDSSLIELNKITVTAAKIAAHPLHPGHN